MVTVFARPRAKVLTIAFCLSMVGLTQGSNSRTVALTGDHAPGTLSGVRFSLFPFDFDGFDGPVINLAGETAFPAQLIGSGVVSSNNRGIWSESSGSLALVAREGDHAPGTPSGVNYNRFQDPLINTAGETAFLANLIGNGVDGSNNDGIWLRNPGTISATSLIVREGDQAPGTSSGVIFSILESDSILLNSAGKVGFASSLAGTNVNNSNNEGVWSEGSGSLAKVARAGDHAPGTASGVNFRFIFEKHPVLNSAGETAFHADLIGTGVDSTNNEGIWMGRTHGSLRLVARSGDHAPGTSSGVNFRNLNLFGSSPALNSSGKTAFLALVTGSGVDTTNNIGIWSEGSGSLSLVARQGEQAPDTPVGINFDLLADPVLNATGQIAFWATLTGSGIDNTNDEGIWSGISDSLHLVARGGDHAPGTPSGVNFASLSITSPVLNAAGQTAFIAGLNGSGVDFTNNVGIWATDQASVLRLIARAGDQLEVAPDDIRTIRSLDFRGGSGNDDGRGSGFNDRGQLAFRALFNDFTEGIFVSNIASQVSITGDYNGDNVVDAADYTVWRDSLGATVAPYSGADGSGDGTVNDADYAVWKANFGNTLAGGGSAAKVTDALATVPEPAGASLLALLAMMIAQRRTAKSALS